MSDKVAAAKDKNFEKPPPEPIPAEMFAECINEWKNPLTYHQKYDMIHSQTEIKKKMLDKELNLEKRRSSR